MIATALLHREQIIAGIASGKRISDLGLSVSRQAISKVLKNDPEYREAIEIGLDARLDLAEQRLEATSDSVDVARAKALWQSTAWRAERECPHRWGVRQPDAGVAIQIVLGNVRGDDSQREKEVIADVQHVTNSVMRHNADSEYHDATSHSTDARTQHLNALASLTTDQLAALVALAQTIKAGGGSKPQKKAQKRTGSHAPGAVNGSGRTPLPSRSPAVVAKP